jgi:pimeloyl-ACP methyl ester carboxylesterase
VISVRLPVVWNHDAFSRSLDMLLEALGVQACHLYGVSLGGLLLQNYASLYPQVRADGNETC